MSLLMKALKQAEQRHQQATAEALEKSAAEPASGVDTGTDAQAGSGTASRHARADADPLAARPRPRSRRSGGTTLALEEARDALDDAATDTVADTSDRATAAESVACQTTEGTADRAAEGTADHAAQSGDPTELADPAHHSSPDASGNARQGSARSPAYAELSLANDHPTMSTGADATPGEVTGSRPISRRAGDPSQARAADRSIAMAPATAAPAREAPSLSITHDVAAPRPADGAFDSRSHGTAPGDPPIEPASHLQPRVGRSSSRNRRIGLWAGVGTAVVVTGAWFGWQLLAPPTPLASAGVPPLQALPPAAAPTPGDASPAIAADSPAATDGPATRPSGAAPLSGPTTRSGVVTSPASDKQPAPASAAPASVAPASAAPASAAPSSAARAPATPAPAAPAPTVPAVVRPSRSVAANATRAPAAPGTAEVSPRAVEPPARLAEPAAHTAPTPRAESAPAGRPGTVRLVRSDEGERLARMLDSAYTALQTRDIEAARAIYEQVLAADPNNTDALAGLATYSARAGSPLQAERLFNQVLAIDPNDQAARAGLVALRTSGDPAAQESQLRHLIAQDDSQPALHYALGNVLAAQGRWAEAQQSYFIASAGDADQPDYAYNLAVSLERLKQTRAAAAQYRRALELAAGRPARFPIDRARARLAALDGAARQGD